MHTGDAGLGRQSRHLRVQGAPLNGASVFGFQPSDEGICPEGNPRRSYLICEAVAKSAEMRWASFRAWSSWEPKRT